MKGFSVIQMAEVLFSIVILTTLITLLYTTGKLLTRRSKIVDEILRKTGEKFEIFLKERCYFNDAYIFIRVGERNYMCGNGEIKEEK